MGKLEEMWPVRATGEREVTPTRSVDTSPKRRGTHLLGRKVMCRLCGDVGGNLAYQSYGRARSYCYWLGRYFSETSGHSSIWEESDVSLMWGRWRKSGLSELREGEKSFLLAR